MSKLYYSLVIWVFLIGGTTVAQVNNNFRNESSRVKENHFSNIISYYRMDSSDTLPRPNHFLGSPYLNEQFVRGDIYVEDKKFASGVALRYNAYADEIEVKESMEHEDETAQPLVKSSDLTIKIGEDTFIALPASADSDELFYFEILYLGSKEHLFKRSFKIFSPEQKSANGRTRDIPAIFKEKTTYYLVNKENRFLELPKTRNKFVKVFNEHNVTMKECIKKYHLDIDKEADLKRLIRYYNTL